MLGHMEVEGNERASEIAKEAAERANRKKCLERFTSLTHIIRTITERKWEESKH